LLNGGGASIIVRSLILFRVVFLSGAILIAADASQAAPPGGGAEQKNMRLVGYHGLQGRGAYQIVIQEQAGRSRHPVSRDVQGRTSVAQSRELRATDISASLHVSRWIAYIGHHAGSARNPLTGRMESSGTSIVDVTDPANPVYLHHIPGSGGAQMVQTCRGRDLPIRNDNVYLLRANGDVSHEVWDVTDPGAPARISTPVSGGHATHKNWWDCKSGMAFMVYDGSPVGWRTSRLLWVVDLSDPARPKIVRQFGLPGHEPGSPISAPPGAHEATLSPRGDRLYIAYGTGSNGVMQIVDVQKLLACRPSCPAKPTADELLRPQVGRLDMPSFWGGHTAWPVIGIEVAEHAKFLNASPRDFVVLVSESFAAECRESAHHMVFMVDITDETRPFPVANYQVPESAGGFCSRGGRFGAHSVSWSYNRKYYKKLIFVSYFNAGVRAVDIRDPFHPKEAGYFIPPVVAGEAVAQTNNVEVDERGYIYLVDRAGAGLHITALTGAAAEIAKQ
jgi:hypothetical protein